MKHLQKLLILLCLICPSLLLAKHLNTERVYQLAFAKNLQNAQIEVVAPDGTRCDILTAEFAIEVDFANKWAEAIGQSLNYAMQFNKSAGIVLILEIEADYKYYIRLNTIVEHFKLPIKIWLIKADNLVEGKNQRIKQKETDSEFRLSKSGKRHNKSCRFYNAVNASPCGKDEGIACKTCGG